MSGKKEYPETFIKYTVSLYRTYQSSIKVRARLRKELDKGKWAGINKIPVEATILKWVEERMDDTYDMVIDDPVKKGDVELIVLSNTILRRARRDIGRLRFRNMSEIIAALRGAGEMRRRFLEMYKADQNIESTVEEHEKQERSKSKILKELKKGSKLSKELRRSARDNVIDFLNKKEGMG